MTTRTSSNAAEAAANEASQAARVMQQRGQDVRAETLHLPRKEKAAETAPAESKAADEPRKEIVSGNEFIKDAHRGNKYRDAVVDEIRARRGEPKDDAPAADPETKPIEPKPPVAPQQEAPVPHETTPATEAVAEPVKTIRVKVDGEEFDAPEVEVNEAGGLKAFQIQRAAENRLKKANEALASVRATQDQSVRTQEQIAEWIKSQKPAEPVVTDEEFIKSKMDDIRFGSPEDSAKALQAVLDRRQQPKQDQGQLVQQAIANINRNAALVAFKRDFQDVAANEILKPSFEALERAALSPYMTQAGVNWNGLSELDFSGIYNKIGHQVRSVMGPRPSQPLPSAAGTALAGTEVAATSGSTSQLSEKEARKSSIVEPPKAAAARAALPEGDSKPETREEQLKRIKRSRGLPVD